jgi:tetratricopeptide (TPR) repeat protein
MQGILLQKKKDALTALYTGDSVAFRYYLESIELRIKGLWREAGDKLVKSADTYNTLKMSVEAATIYYESGECFIKVDKTEAINCFRKAAKVYCDIGRFDIAGRIERRIGIMHYRIFHWEDALYHFKKAADFFSGDRDIDQSDRCYEITAECSIQIGKYDEARSIYETIARSCVTTNLRRFVSCRFLLKAIICLFGKEIYIDEVKPIIINGKSASAYQQNTNLQKELEKIKNQYLKPGETMEGAGVKDGNASIEGGAGTASLTSRTSMRSNDPDDNSSIQTLEQQQKTDSKAQSTVIPDKAVTSPAKPTDVNNAAPGVTSPKTSANLGAPDDHSNAAGKTSINEQSTATGSTSFQDRSSAPGAPGVTSATGPAYLANRQGMTSMQFQGLTEEQITPKLPHDAVVHLGIPKEFKYEMPDSVRNKCSEIQDRMNYYTLIDFMWKGSKEYYFLSNLLKFRCECNYFDFIDHLYYWNNVYPFNDVSLVCLKFPIIEMQKERENNKITKLNIEVNNAIRNRRTKKF